MYIDGCRFLKYYINRNRNQINWKRNKKKKKKKHEPDQ